MTEREDVLDKQLTIGIILVTFGIVFTLFSHIVLQIVPLTAIGIAAILLGTTIAITSPQPIPKETIQLLINNTIQNIEALLEEFTTIEKAIYIPKKEKIYAYIPLNPNPETKLAQVKNAPQRLIIKTGEHYGLQLIPLGAELLKTLEPLEERNLEDTLKTMLVDLADIADDVKTAQKDNTIIVEITGTKIEVEAPRYLKTLGTIPSSIAATTVAATLKKPVKIVEETIEKRKITAKIQILEE